MRYCVALAALSALLVLGCGPVSQAELDQAKALVEEGLEAWKKGSPPTGLKSSHGSFEFEDDAWSRGDPLASFEIEPARYHGGEKMIRCAAKLVFVGPGGEQRAEKVVYNVILGPPAKVFNNPMP